MDYESFMNEIYNSSSDEWLYNDELGRFILRNDIRIAIVAENSIENRELNRFYEEWANNFPDREAYQKQYTLEFNGCYIETFNTVAVDGSRSYIPLPNLDTMTITRNEYIIGQIINSVHGHNFDEYLEGSQIQVI